MINKLVNSEDYLPQSREKLIEKAMKLKAMTESNQEGERESATQFLADFMQKHDITWKDLDDTIEQEFFIPFTEEYQRKLLVQITYMHAGSGHCYALFKKNSEEDEGQKTNSIVIKCRPIDFLNIKLDWEFYWEKFQEELDMFYRAFIEQNQLFPPENLQSDDDSDDNENLSEEQIRKINKMAQGIDVHTRLVGITESSSGGTNT